MYALWSDERTSTLKKLWADGFTASQIAKRLGGITRNAVIGKVFRLGLARRNAPETHSARRQKAAAKRAMVRIPRSVLRPLKRETLATEQALIRALPALGGHVAETHGCKFIPGDPAIDARCCGRQPVADSAWCVQHHKLVYTPSKPRARVRSPERDERRRWLRQLQQDGAAL